MNTINDLTINHNQNFALYIPPNSWHNTYAEEDNLFLMFNIPLTYIPNWHKNIKYINYLDDKWAAARRIIELEVGEEANDSAIVTDMFMYILNMLYKEELPNSIKYIHNNYTRKITIKELAAIENYNSTYYCEWFLKKYDQTPLEYVTSLRMEVVKMKELKYSAVMFDLLTALLDSWSVWTEVTGDDEVAKKWRLKYLHLTYGQGIYRPYEELVSLAAQETGLPQTYADKLVENWGNIKPWPEVKEVLTELKKHVPLAVVTNCSQVLGLQAVELCGVELDVVVTSERAGFYKPNPAPYRLAIQELGIEPQKILYVSGSAFDIPGATNEGMAVYWHNRIGMVKPEECPGPKIMTTSLLPLKDFIWKD